MEYLDLRERCFDDADVEAVVPGLSANTFRQWVKRRQVVLDDPHPGTGRKRLLTALDVVGVAFVHQAAKEGGLPLMVAAQFAQAVRSDAEAFYQANPPQPVLWVHFPAGQYGPVVLPERSETFVYPSQLRAAGSKWTKDALEEHFPELREPLQLYPHAEANETAAIVLSPKQEAPFRVLLVLNDHGRYRFIDINKLSGLGRPSFFSGVFIDYWIWQALNRILARKCTTYVQSL